MLTTNFISAKTVAKAIYSRKKRNKTTESNVSDHFNNIFLSNSQLTYVKALQPIAKSAYDFHIHKISYIYKKRKSVLEEKCWHLASCKSPVSERTITRIGSENLENNAYHG